MLCIELFFETWVWKLIWSAVLIVAKAMEAWYALLYLLAWISFCLFLSKFPWTVLLQQSWLGSIKISQLLPFLGVFRCITAGIWNGDLLIVMHECYQLIQQPVTCVLPECSHYWYRSGLTFHLTSRCPYVQLLWQHVSFRAVQIRWSFKAALWQVFGTHASGHAVCTTDGTVSSCCTR